MLSYLLLLLLFLIDGRHQTLAKAIRPCSQTFISSTSLVGASPGQNFSLVIDLTYPKRGTYDLTIEVPDGAFLKSILQTTIAGFSSSKKPSLVRNGRNFIKYLQWRLPSGVNGRKPSVQQIVFSFNVDICNPPAQLPFKTSVSKTTRKGKKWCETLSQSVVSI